MATTTPSPPSTMEVSSINNNKVQQLFEDLEAQETLLTKCTDLYKTLTSHFTSLQTSTDSRTLTLDSKLQSLDSIHQQSLSDLETRENAIPNRFLSLSSEIESKKQSAIEELQKEVDTDASLSEVLKSLCRRMDCGGLIRFVVGRRKEKRSLRDELREALKECVDPERMVLETVKEFVEAKATAKRMADKRWACGLVVSGLFPLEELKVERKGVLFSRKTVSEAEELVRDWRERVKKSMGHGGGGGNGEGKMGSAEVAMFLQVVVGFGLTEIFEVEFYKKIVMEFAAARRDMAKLAIPIFGDKLSDFIDQLIENGKEVEAVYFASESGLTERFRLTSLLQSCLDNSKNSTTGILKKGNYNASATDEANNIEMSHIRSIIKCVVDHNLEAAIPLDNLKKRLLLLEKAKVDKKGSESTKSIDKRTHISGGPPRRSGGPPPRPLKRTKYPSYVRREVASSAVSSVSRYLGPYSLSGQTAYDPGLTVYGQRYGGSLVQSADPNAQQHHGVSSSNAPSPSAGPWISSYVVPGASVPNPSAGTQHGNSYSLQSAYGVYDYGATTTSTYQPPPYAP